MDLNLDRNYFLDLLIMTFGVSAWIGTTATFLQLPQFVQYAPESLNLPSYLVILTQSGNIASLLYIIYVKWCSLKVSDVSLIYFTLGIGALASILMVFFCKDTIAVNGQQRSIPLFICTAMFAFVGCLSSVLFMPFIGRFRGIYLVSYLFGQGLNGLLSSVLSLVQGVGTVNCFKNNVTDKTDEYSEPLFQPSIYFLFIFCIFVLSIVAFVLLNEMNFCNHKMELNDQIQNENGYCNNNEYESIQTNVIQLSENTLIYVMVILGFMSFLTYGFLPGLQSYSSLSYGVSAYHLSTTLSSIVNPLACLLSMYVSKPHVRVITLLSSITALLSVYILLTAVQSPKPPLYLSASGFYLIVSILTNFENIYFVTNQTDCFLFCSYCFPFQIIVWTVYTGLATYIKLSILQLVRCHGQTTLKWAGCIIQLNSCFGAVVVFMLVNKTSFFTNYDPCIN